MKRTSLLLATALPVLTGLLFHLPANAKSPHEQPNIIFLLADDMGYGDLGSFGSEIIQSPHLDKLAAEGMRLTQCYAASPNCSPARAGILTGRTPYRVGMYDFARFENLHVPTAETTIAEKLKSAGYQTMFAGKWHLSGDYYSGKQPYPGDHGFDHWLANASNFGKDAQGFLRNGEAVDQVDGWMSEVVVNEAMEWIDERETDKPFFTCLWFSEPHTPVLAADEFRALYPKEKVTEHLTHLRTSGGPTVKRRAELKDPDLYFGCVTMLDHHIGRLLNYLDEKNLSENTLIVFTSDNGPEHRTVTAFGSSANLSGAKGHMHEGGIRVPGIVRWPGRIEAGSTSNEPIIGTDWLPTFCAAAGVDPTIDKPLDGTNTLPALLDQKPLEREIPLFWWLWHARGGYETAMRIGDYKLLATMVPQKSPGNINDAVQPEGWSILKFVKEAELSRFALYNLQKDPAEKHNLSETQPKRFQQLKERMISLYEEIQAEGPPIEMYRKQRK